MSTPFLKETADEVKHNAYANRKQIRDHRSAEQTNDDPVPQKHNQQTTKSESASSDSKSIKQFRHFDYLFHFLLFKVAFVPPDIMYYTVSGSKCQPLNCTICEKIF